MHFEKGNIYHIYNRGNNRQKIFFNHDNYIYFLKKVRKHILPVCDILCYTLMPNHFHFLIYANDKTVKTKFIKGKEKNLLSEGIRVVLSTYAQGINKQENRTGSLFTQNTNAKAVMDSFHNYYYSDICFYYILQNPLKAKLVNQLEDWPYSSFPDFASFRKGTLCNIALAKKLIFADWDNFYNSAHNYSLNSTELLKIF